MTKNILFIMADQLRRDYLSCYGARHMSTPHIDALATRGVRFDRAYVQGPVCGVSRMSYYTGRYMASHGSNWNFVPLPLHNPTLGDHLRALGLRVGVVGKTHVTADREGLIRVGADLSSPIARRAAEGGFEADDRDDGIWPGSSVPNDNRYANYLRQHGFGGRNPWHDWANSGIDSNGVLHSGWSMRWAHLPAAVPDEHSETAYTTRRAMDFMSECGDAPWCLHLSYIKPHWPYVAPAPYHGLYGADDVPAPVRGTAEQARPHPVLRGFQAQPASRNFSDNARRLHVVPAYMGLVKQIDDQLGRLFAFMEERNLWSDTLVVFCSDHGDYLGDHWLGEKELFHETVVAVPLIVASPERDSRRGAVEDRLVEAIDLLPTFVDCLGGTPATHQLEGRSLRPLLHSKPFSGSWREFVVSEGDYSFRSLVREPLGRPVNGCRMFMIRSSRWKYVHFEGLPAQLFDLQDDPTELDDLGADPAKAQVREEHATALFDWLRGLRIHPTASDRDAAAWTVKESRSGTLIGVW